MLFTVTPCIALTIATSSLVAQASYSSFCFSDKKVHKMKSFLRTCKPADGGNMIHATIIKQSA